MPCMLSKPGRRNIRAGKKELAKLVEHAQDRKAQGWYISKGDFTSDALSYAIEQGVYVSDEAGLQELKKGTLKIGQIENFYH